LSASESHLAKEGSMEIYHIVIGPYGV
jgi:hypothetical protein